MYSWSEDTSSWYGKGEYKYRGKGAAKRKMAAERAKASGPRTYEGKKGPNEKIIAPEFFHQISGHHPLFFQERGRIFRIDFKIFMNDSPDRLIGFKFPEAVKSIGIK